MGFSGDESVPAPVGSAFSMPKLTRFVMDSTVKFHQGQHLHAKYDAQGNIVFSNSKTANENSVDIKGKFFSLRNEWKVSYRKGLLFTMARSSFFGWKGSYDIFLPGNLSSNPDVIVKRDNSKHNFTVYYSDVTMAEIQRRRNHSSGFDKYDINIRPGMDNGFIILIAHIIEKENQAERR